MLAPRSPDAALEGVELDAADDAVVELLGAVVDAAEDTTEDVGIRVEAVGKTSEVEARLQNDCASASADASGTGKVVVADAAEDDADDDPLADRVAVELAAVEAGDDAAVVHCDMSAKRQSYRAGVKTSLAQKQATSVKDVQPVNATAVTKQLVTMNGSESGHKYSMCFTYCKDQHRPNLGMQRKRRSSLTLRMMARP